MDRYGHLMPEADQALSDRVASLYSAPAAAPLAPMVGIASGGA